MATVTEIVNRAARLAGVKAQNQDLSSYHSVAYVDLFNEMLDSWAIEGTDLGLSELVASDEVYVGRPEMLCIRYNLAVLIAEDAKRPIDDTVKSRAFSLFQSVKAAYHAPDSEMEIDPILLINQSSASILNDQ